MVSSRSAFSSLSSSPLPWRTKQYQRAENIWKTCMPNACAVASASSIVFSRTYIPETGEAVVAMRMIECVRDMS